MPKVLSIALSCTPAQLHLLLACDDRTEAGSVLQALLGSAINTEKIALNDLLRRSAQTGSKVIIRQRESQ